MNVEQGSDYGRLLADRDRLIQAGVDPVALAVPLPPLDPDPLYVEATYQAGWDDGFERGITESIPPIVGLLVIGIVTFVFGLAVGLTWSAFG